MSFRKVYFYKGKYQTIKQHYDEFGNPSIALQTVYSRMRWGLSLADALTLPHRCPPWTAQEIMEAKNHCRIETRTRGAVNTMLTRLRKAKAVTTQNGCDT